MFTFVSESNEACVHTRKFSFISECFGLFLTGRGEHRNTSRNKIKHVVFLENVSGVSEWLDSCFWNCLYKQIFPNVYVTVIVLKLVNVLKVN